MDRGEDPYYDRPIGRLNWVSGFALENDAWHLEASFSPVLQCLRFDAKGGRPVLEAARVSSCAFSRSISLGNFGYAELGRYYYLDRNTLPMAPVQRPVEIERRYQFRSYDFDADQGEIVSSFPGDSYDRIRPIIATHSSYGDRVATYVVRTGSVTIVVPCSVIFAACYYIDSVTMRRYFSREGLQRLSAAANVTFTGLRFIRNDMLRRSRDAIDAIRAVRDVEFAEAEAAQIVPRALAHVRSASAGLALLVRPPFRGVARIMGSAIDFAHEGNKYSLFVRAQFRPIA